MGLVADEDTSDRLRRVQEFRESIGDIIAGAYWGLMIDKSLVAKLGGLARIQREAPVHAVEELAAGAVLLQATPRPMLLTDPELQRVLPALEAYLDPISAPIGPFFRSRYT